MPKLSVLGIVQSLIAHSEAKGYAQQMRDRRRAEGRSLAEQERSAAHGTVAHDVDLAYAGAVGRLQSVLNAVVGAWVGCEITGQGGGDAAWLAMQAAVAVPRLSEAILSSSSTHRRPRRSCRCHRDDRAGSRPRRRWRSTEPRRTS